MGPVVPQHLGGLHPFEQLLVAVIAFGPFVVLAVVVARQRRQAADSVQTRRAPASSEQRSPE